MRHRLPQFSHMFSRRGLCGRLLQLHLGRHADAPTPAEAFAEAPGGFYDRAMARRLLRDVLSVGNTVDPGEAYPAVSAAATPAIDALMRDRGFAPALT